MQENILEKYVGELEFVVLIRKLVVDDKQYDAFDSSAEQLELHKILQQVLSDCKQTLGKLRKQ